MNSDKIYRIDFKKLLFWITPDELKKPRVGVFLQAMGYPFKLLYNAFMLFRKQMLYRLKITPQVCYLEMLLNDRFDFTSRRIYIDDGLDKPPFYIYTNPELKPKYIRKRSEQVTNWIYTSGESGNLRDDFIIYVPAGLVFDQLEMISLVKDFKLAGTKFKIQIY